ncbi:MAG: helix-turn-helix domain-containing protein [Fusobacterium sp.]|nr:helix-turn-helix domain-containing protein [Fusobacterium sp.]
MTNRATKLKLLGKNISKYRKQKGYTQNKLGDLLNMSREHIAKVETAKRNPSLDLIFEIAETLEINESDLFNFKDGTK